MRKLIGKRAIFPLLGVIWLPAVLVSCEHGPQIVQPPQPTGLPAPLGLSGSFPRFPHDTEARALRDVMVFYSPDDISSNITWKSIGFPDSGFFLIHNAFPKLKITLQTVPENRYLGDIPNRNIERDPVAARIWRDLAMQPGFRAWLEFGNHGYFHSPAGDANLDNHEFNGQVNASANDSAFCYGIFAKARATYAAIGLDNERIRVMRFPGSAHTPMALQALADNGFLAFFENRRAGRERFVPAGAGREILAIPTVPLETLFGIQALTEGIRSRQIDSAGLRGSAAYAAAAGGALAALDSLVGDGGVINLFDHWWEHSRNETGGIHCRFELFQDLLRGLERKYGNRIWWGFGSELALWSWMRRDARVSIETDVLGATVSFAAPPAWTPGWTFTAGYTLATNDSSDFPPPSGIRLSLESEGYAKSYPLDKNRYWVSGSRLHFDFPFSGTLKVRIAFDGNDRG